MDNTHKSPLRSFGAAFTKLWNRQEGLSLKTVRWNRSFYMLAYTLELLFYAYHKTFLHTDSKLFGIDSSMLMYIGHILMSLVIMLLWSNRFRHLIYISVAVTALGFVSFFFLPDGIPKLLCAVMVMTGLGGCVTAARCGFAFAVGNTERLVGVALALGGRALLNFIDVIFPDEGFWDNALFYYVFPILFLAGMIFCLLRFREADMEVKETATPEGRKGLYWAFAIFIAYFALEGYTELMDNPNYGDAMLMEGFGKLIAVAVFVFVLLRLQKSVWHIFNAFFGLSIVAALLSGFTDSPALLAPTHLLLGVCEIGWIAALYMLSCAQRRFASYKLLKQCTVVFVILSPITTLSDEMVSMFFKEHITVVALVYAIVIALAFLMVSPYTQKYLFGAKWMDDLQKRDMELIYAKIEEIDRFEQFKLSDREKEVLALLLSTNTIRQVSAHLSIAQGTANTYANRLYKKVGVNNRMELFQKFGVTHPYEKDN